MPTQREKFKGDYSFDLTKPFVISVIGKLAIGKRKWKRTTQAFSYFSN